MCSQTWGHERDGGKLAIGQVTAERKDMKNRDNRTFLTFTCNLLTMCALRFMLKKVSFRHTKAHLSPPRSSPFTLRLVSDDRRLWTFLDKNRPSPPFEAADPQHQTAQKKQRTASWKNRHDNDIFKPTLNLSKSFAQIRIYIIIFAALNST